MQTLIHGGWLYYSRSFCVGILLILATSCSWSSPTTPDYKLATIGSASLNTKTNLKRRSPTRWIEIDLSEQQLSAWEGKKLVYSFQISTGKRRTPTPIGRFEINSKYRTNRMRGRGYDISDVPYTMYFYEGYAIHGAYWHDNFGTPVSHGCVNLRVKQARRLYNWAKVGTLVVVHR